MTAHRSSFAALTAVLLLGGSVTAASAATTRFVATAAHGGNDNGGANICATAGSPCLTVGHAVNKAASGDTIQIGPGRFVESVSATTKSLTFVGAGSGTPTSFDATSETFVDALGTANPGFTLGNHNSSFRGLMIRGGLGSGNLIEPAISAAGGASVPTLNISGAVLLQANPAAPGSEQYALLVNAGANAGANVTVTNSAIVGYGDGVRVFAQAGTLTITDSTIRTPAPAQNGPILPLSATLATDVPTSITHSTLLGITAIASGARLTQISRSVISASGVGVALSDGGDGPTLSIRNSVIEPASGTMLRAVSVGLPVPGETLVPFLDLTFDSLLALSTPSAIALNLSNAAAGTHVHTRNTILRAIDTSGGSGADDIASGSQAINWDLGYTDYTQTSGVAVPPPGSGTNLNVLPFFVGQGDLRLGATSTLFDRGDPSVVQAGETDLTGALRSVAHACGGTARPDLGAFEAPAPGCPPPTISIGSPASGATYTQGQTVTASYACAAPAPATLSACTGAVASGARIDTGTVGSHTFTVTATASDGAAASASATYTVKAPTPSLGAIHVSHKTFRVGGKLARLAAASQNRRKPKPPVGTTFGFSLNTAATVKLTFTHRAGGRKVKGKCVAQTKHNRQDGACRRTATDGTLKFTGHAGTDKVTFQGRLSKRHKLAPGTYTLAITSTNPSGHSRTRSTTFTIARG